MTLLLARRGSARRLRSWIVRNYRGSDHVAVLDVHVMRACSVVGTFAFEAVTPRDYERLEQAYLRFAEASQLDALIWDYMRRLSSPDRNATVQLALL